MTEGQTPRRLCRTVSAHLLGGLLWMGLVDVAIRRSHRLDRMVPGATHLLEEAGALEQLAPPPDFFGGRSMTADDLLFRDRRHAGRVLATHLEQYRGRAGLLVLALPRGGVAVGFEVARELRAPLDIFVVRKLGVPGHEEYAMGAIASGGVKFLNPMPGLTVRPEAIAAVVEREQAELVRREHLYRKQRPAVPLQGRTVIVVDDGLATGSTMQAAVLAIRQQHPLHLAVAVPVGALDTCAALRQQADDVICAATPEPFRAVGLWYQEFPQATDDEVCALLEEARREHAIATRLSGH